MKAEMINPKHAHVAGFWSECLYRFIKKNPMYDKVYRGSDGKLYIGNYDNEMMDLCGSKLRSVCCGSARRKFSTFCFSHISFEDVSDWFWDKYDRIGVCAIHGDTAHSWVYGDDERECEYCGKIEHKKIEMIEKVSWI